MDCIAERVENRSYVAVDAIPVEPHIGHGDGDILCKGAGAVDANTLRVGAEMTPASEAIAAASADYVPFRAHHVANPEVVHVRANLDDLAHELMAYNHRHRDGLLRPSIPFVDMQVR